MEDLARVREPGVFLVNDVAFIEPEHGMAIGREIERRRITKEYYLETRCDVLVRQPEVFRYGKRLGLNYMVLGIESIDEEGLKAFRKRSTTDVNIRAVELARQLGLSVAVNLIVDPAWDERQFATVRQWATEMPEIVHLTVQTPHPGTETWQSVRAASRASSPPGTTGSSTSSTRCSPPRCRCTASTRSSSGPRRSSPRSTSASRPWRRRRGSWVATSRTGRRTSSR